MTLKQRLKLYRSRARKYAKKARHYSIAARRNKAKAKRTLKRIQAAKQGPSAALRWALAQVGTYEQPSGSNRGPKITPWQQAFGAWLVGQPWCGVFVGTAMKQGGVKNVTSRVAAVAYIEDDARAGRNGFAKLVPKSQAQPGDAVILFGRGVHVGLVVANKGTYLETVEGNTSPGSSGSQSNGGGVYRRVRSMSDVYAVARPAWPS